MTSKIRFHKLQATGNDFILVDSRQNKRNWARMAKRLCERHYGIGADGLIVVLPSTKADLKMRIFNPDGSEAETCGNGLRCFAKYVIEQQIVAGPRLTVETLSGINELVAHLRKRKVTSVTVNMGRPRFEPSALPVIVDSNTDGSTPVLDYRLDIGNQPISLAFVSMGNPHAVTFTYQPVSEFPLASVGPLIETHPIFPKRTNFEVAHVLDSKNIEARVWERGVGETLACGTGACAVAVVGQLLGFVGSDVDITLPGGTLSVSWQGRGEVMLTGPVTEVFIGEIAL